MSRRRNPLIVAADLSDAAAAEALARRLVDSVAMVKVGLELFTAAGPDVVARVRGHVPVFLDLKLHDIPSTVERAARNAGRLGATMVTVHALGGPTMVRAAREGSAEGAAEAGVDKPSIVAVTVLSSMAGEELASPSSLAFEAVAAGARGVVVSGKDVKEVRRSLETSRSSSFRGSGPPVSRRTIMFACSHRPKPWSLERTILSWVGR